MHLLENAAVLLFDALLERGFVSARRIEQVLIAGRPAVHDLALGVNGCINKGMSGATVLGLDVVKGVADAHVRIEGQVHREIGDAQVPARPKSLARGIAVHLTGPKPGGYYSLANDAWELPAELRPVADSPPGGD